LAAEKNGAWQGEGISQVTSMADPGCLPEECLYRAESALQLAHHTYADGPNTYTISATATNSNGTYASNALAVTVNPINPTVSISGPSSVNEGSLYTLTLSGTPDSADAPMPVECNLQGSLPPEHRDAPRRKTQFSLVSRAERQGTPPP
jgi:hypothetical protein